MLSVGYLGWKGSSSGGEGSGSLMTLRPGASANQPPIPGQVPGLGPDSLSVCQGPGLPGAGVAHALERLPGDSESRHRGSWFTAAWRLVLCRRGVALLACSPCSVLGLMGAPWASWEAGAAAEPAFRFFGPDPCPCPPDLGRAVIPEGSRAGQGEGISCYLKIKMVKYT